MSQRTRPSVLDRVVLGDDYSLNVAFIRCVGNTPMVYTMQKMKKNDDSVIKLRNCQGGWAKSEDEDAFSAAARVARESRDAIPPFLTDSSQWQSDLANRLRQLYSDGDNSISVCMSQNMKTDPTSNLRVLKTHIAIRVILPAEDPLYDGVLFGQHTSSTVNEGDSVDNNWRWEDLAFINQSADHFHFSFTPDDIDCATRTFKPSVLYVDDRFLDKTITCRGCGSPFTHSAESQQYFKSKQFEDPKDCNACKVAKKNNSQQRGNGGSGGSGGGGSGGGRGSSGSYSNTNNYNRSGNNSKSSYGAGAGAGAGGNTLNNRGDRW